MNLKERQTKIMTAGAAKITQWIGSTNSVVFHTLIFLISFLLPYLGLVDLEKMLLILTTLVSLEAIYLSIFIQISLNMNSESIEIIQEDLQELGDDLDEIGDDLEELSEDIEEIGNDLEGLEEDIEDIQKEFKGIQVEGDQSAFTDRELLISIQKTLLEMKKEINTIKNKKTKE